MIPSTPWSTTRRTVPCAHCADSEVFVWFGYGVHLFCCAACYRAGPTRQGVAAQRGLAGPMVTRPGPRSICAPFEP